MPHTMTYRDIDSVNLPQANRRYFHPQMIHNKQTRNRLGSMAEMFHKTKAEHKCIGFFLLF